jgi:hypothetical protein
MGEAQAEVVEAKKRVFGGLRKGEREYTCAKQKVYSCFSRARDY